ncbi:MAG: hypothetical protein ABI232_06845 [Jatrophihabitantaceae bacterium]
MFTMHEALAREHMREREQQACRARQSHLAHELAAAHRWRYLAARASAAHQRHARRAERAAEAAALAAAR